MFGSRGGVFRFFLLIVVVALLGGAAYYYVRVHPEKAPWKGGAAAVQEKVGAVKLGAEVKTALSLRESTRNLDINVDTEKDVVTLRGKVPSAQVSKEIEGIAASVPGVRQVVNFLEIDQTAGAAAAAGDTRTVGERVDDEALELKVRAAFKLDKELSGVDFEIKAMRRSLQISSATATAAQKKRAADVARSVERVAAVDVR